jgi:predicted secreted protein
MLKSVWLCVPAMLACIPVALAAEPVPPRYNTVTLQAEAQREMQNDLLNATLFVEVNDATPAGVAQAVNKSVNEALRISRDYKNVRVRSGNNQTYPVYSKANQLQGWRGRGEIRIESRDFEAASALVGKLQSSMQLGGLQFTVSPEARRAAENELITEAIAAFKARAEIARTALNGRAYKLQNLNVSSGHHVPPQPRFALARSAAAAQEVAPPNLEAGISLVTVTANGAIELLE